MPIIQVRALESVAYTLPRILVALEKIASYFTSSGMRHREFAEDVRAVMQKDLNAADLEKEIVQLLAELEMNIKEDVEVAND